MGHRASKRASREGRKDIIGEHRLTDIGQIIFAVLFFIVWIADSFFLKRTTFLNQYIPLWLQIVLGTILLVLSAYLARTGMNLVFSEERSEAVVIRKSVFNHVRHPVYLGELLLYLGLIILSPSLAAAVVLLITFAFLHYVARYEENLLLGHFGDEYRQYMNDVPMWLPRFPGK